MADNTKPGILRNLRVKRVSIVDVGANFDTKTGDGAHIMLFKRADVNKDGPGLGSVHVDSTDWRDDYEKATLDSDSRNKLPDSAFAAVWTDSNGVKQRKLPIHDAGHLAAARGRLDAASIPADVKAAARRKIEAASKTGNHKEKNVKKSILQKMLGLFGETDATKRAAGLEEVTKALDDLDDDDMKKAAHDPDDKMCKCADCMQKRKNYTGDPVVVEAMIAKGVTAALSEVEKKHKAEVDELKKQLTATSTAVATEIEKRQDAEMLVILKGFKHVPLDLAKDVPTFRKMKAADPAMYDSMIERLNAAEAALATSSLFKQFGTTRHGGKGDAWAQLEAKADALVEKSTNGLTREQAIEKVSLDPANAALIKQYREEQM